MNLYDAIVVADNLQAAELSKTQKMRQIIGKIQNSNLHGNDNSIQEVEWIFNDHKRGLTDNVKSDMLYKAKLVEVMLVNIHMYVIYFMSMMKLDTRQSIHMQCFAFIQSFFEHFKLHIIIDMKIYLQV